jgi:hypothetical protein
VTGAKQQGVVGVFSQVEGLVAAVRALRREGLEIGDIYSPVHHAELTEIMSPGPSPVRFATFGGAAAGLLSGLGLALLTTAVWELVVGGKPYYSLVPYLVVGFELTILFGALATLAGLLVAAGLPERSFPAAAYRPEFSADRFGVWVAGPEGKLDQAREVLEQCGAVEVQGVGVMGGEG